VRESDTVGVGWMPVTGPGPLLQVEREHYVVGGDVQQPHAPVERDAQELPVVLAERSETGERVSNTHTQRERERKRDAFGENRRS
jgi:hypothetical protein